MSDADDLAGVTTWVYDRPANIHRFGDRATVRKAGTGYTFVVAEPPSEYLGVQPTLKRAKQSAESRLHQPEPTRYHCYDCRQFVSCTMAWTGAPYHWWAQSWPGAIQPIDVGNGFAFVSVCSACMDVRKAVS